MTRARSTGLAVVILILALFVPVPVQAADDDAIELAIQKGVASLKAQQGRDGKWAHNEIGATALAALALLECGVEAEDPSVAAAARAIRAEVPQLTQTYSIALSILFLDRLGFKEDVPLIESLTVRLLAGQSPMGTWSYTCPAIGEAEARRLAAVLVKANEGGKPAANPPRDPRNPRELPNEIQKQLNAIEQPLVPPFGPGAPVNAMGMGDNSNTQFAILGLWVGRRHGLPVGRALARTDAYFRASQSPTGGWGYTPPMGGGAIAGDATPAMTCAGLLGLALGYGVAKEAMDKKDPKGKPAAPVDLSKDMVIKRGILALGTAIGQPRGNAFAPGINVPVLQGGANGRGFYFLWSLERVAVALNLETIGNKDWYGWGSEIILANQAQDGSWQGEYGGGGVDTSFALLFLRKANLARDLTATLKGVVKDPDQRELLGGGVGGAAFLKKIGLKPAFDNSARPGKKPEGGAPPKRRVEGEAAKLSDEVVKAPAARQERLLEELRDNKGAVYTDALADAVSRLEGEMKSKARDALADRLTRMTSATLKDKLDDADPEVRRAASLAVAMKEDKSHLARLVELLEDEETFVVRAAHAALKSFSGRDLGSPAAASKEERAKAIAAWKAWLAKQNR